MTLANINEIIYITDTFLLKSLWINNQWTNQSDQRILSISMSGNLLIKN